MRSVAINPLQICVGLYCVSLGTLMLITPHQFLSRAFLPWQAHLGWWGSIFLLAGCLLFGAALMQLRKQPRLLIHLFAGGALLSLAYAFIATQAWSGISSYLVLGVGTAVAPLLVREPAIAPSTARPPIDLFTVLMGIAAILTGLMMLGLPEFFQSALYAPIYDYLHIHGSAFLVGGLALGWAQLGAPYRPAWVAICHIVGGSAFLAFCVTTTIPAHSLTGIAFYGGLGLSVLLMPWLTGFFKHIDPTRLQTRLALALIALSAIPLILSVAVISDRQSYTATQQTLARERILARNLARNTHTFVTLHQSATVLLAQQLTQVPAEDATHAPLLIAFQQACPEFRNVLSYNAAGELISRSTLSADTEPLTRPVTYGTVRDTLLPQITVGPTPFSSTPVFKIGAPILTETGAFAGLVIGVLDSVDLSQMWIESAQISEGEVYLVDANGRVIAALDAELMAQFADRSATPSVMAALDEQQVGSITYDTDNGPRLSSYAPLPDLNWYVIIDRPANIILSGLRAGQDLTIGILLIVVGLAALTSVLLARTLSIPLTMLARATRTITQSEPPTPLPQSAIYEVALLAEQFAELRDSLQERTAERNRAEQRLQLLADAGTALTTSLDAEPTLEQITRLMVPALGDWGLIYLAEADKPITLAAATHIDPMHQAIAQALYAEYPINPNGTHGVAHVLRTGRSEVITQINDEMLAAGARDAEHLRLLRQIGFHAVMIVPLNARGRTLGALVLVSANHERSYDAEDLALAEDLAHRAALAAANALLYAAERTAREEAEAATARNERLQQVTAALAGALTPEAVAEVMLTEGAAAIAADAGLVALTTEDGGQLSLVHAVGYPPDLIAAHTTFALDAPLPLAEAARTCTPIMINSLTEAQERFPNLNPIRAQSGLQAWMNLPLRLNDRCLGALELSFTQPRTFTVEDSELVYTLAQQCAQALERAQLYVAEKAARNEAELALGARDQFLSIAAHELRTPLTALLGQAQLMERRVKKYPEINERDQRALNVVVNQAQRLDQLITTLFDLNRLQTGQITLQCAPCDLGAMVSRLAEELEPTLKAHTIEVDVPETPLILECDELRMEQILQNLIQNALKYSPDGGQVSVRVALSGEQILLQVRDSGIGIPEEALPYLFEPYFRASNAERSVMQGMGVGLGVVKELVQLHGGTVSVISVEGQGSTFTIALPYTVADVAQPAAAHERV